MQKTAKEYQVPSTLIDMKHILNTTKSVCDKFTHNFGFAGVYFGGGFILMTTSWCTEHKKQISVQLSSSYERWFLLLDLMNSNPVQGTLSINSNPEQFS